MVSIKADIDDLYLIKAYHKVKQNRKDAPDLHVYLVGSRWQFKNNE